MKRFRPSRPSPSLVVAIIALIVALGGTGYAATSLPKNSVGSKQLRKNAVTASKIKKNAVTGSKIKKNSVTGSKIKKNAVTGSKVKDHSLTGADINLGALGTVPNASHAASADNATHAGSADNANALGGHPASAFAADSRLLSSGGVIKIPGTASGNKQTVLTFGPFTVSVTCTKDSANNVSALLDASSSEDNSVLDGAIVSPAGTPDVLDSIPATTSSQDDDNVNYDFEAPSGAGLIIESALGVNSLGTDCWFNYMGLH